MRIPCTFLIPMCLRGCSSFAIWRESPCSSRMKRQLPRLNQNSTYISSFEDLGDKDAYVGWRTIVQRDIRMPSGKVFTFDLLKQKYPAVVVFSWFTKTSTTTLIREFSPGIMQVCSGIVAGYLEKGKHDSILQAAQYELEEEAHLIGGTWIPLLSNDDGETTHASEGKYSTGKIFPFLVIDPIPTLEPRPIDEEEFIQVERNVPIQEVSKRIFKGDMNVTSSYTCLLAMEKLRKMDLI